MSFLYFLIFFMTYAKADDTTDYRTYNCCDVNYQIASLCVPFCENVQYKYSDINKKPRSKTTESRTYNTKQNTHTCFSSRKIISALSIPHPPLCVNILRINCGFPAKIAVCVFRFDKIIFAYIEIPI